MIRSTFFVLMALFALGSPVQAVEPGEMMADPALEARAREISKGLRCVVCQNQSIDDSNADLAKSMRLLVRERITAGDSNSEVTQYLVDRYGDFVLLKPPFKATTLALWLGPIAFGVIALLIGFTVFRKRAQATKDHKGTAPAPLTAAEQKHLDEMLKMDGEDS